MTGLGSADGMSWRTGTPIAKGSDLYRGIQVWVVAWAQRRDMERPTYPGDLTGRERQLLELLPPPPKSGGRPIKYPRREIVHAIRYVLRTGRSWRMLPIRRKRTVSAHPLPLLSHLASR